MDRLDLPRRLLLRQTVQRSKSPHQIDGVNSEHGTVGKEFSEDSEGDAIVGIVKGGNENGGIGDVEIGVAGG